MKTQLPRRLRAPELFALLAATTLAIGGAARGWRTVLDVLPYH
jgi:hypothetical protein